MNGRETQEAEHLLDNARAVHLIDAEAIRRALLGTPTALTELEREASITICDIEGLDRRVTARGLGIPRDTLTQTILRRRDQLPRFTTRLMAAAAVEPAEELVRAVDAADRDAVADVLHRLNRQGLYALAVVLADLVLEARDPDADDAASDEDT